LFRLFHRKDPEPVVYRGAGSAILPDFKGTKEDADRLIDQMLGKSDARPSEEQVLMNIAKEWSKRGTCSRLQVGAIIVKNGRVISSGYNGNCGSGFEHCIHTDDSPCTTASHAEENAIVFAAKSTMSTNNCTMYCTHAPCFVCARMIVNAGIREVIYEVAYRSSSGVDLLISRNVNVRKFSAQSRSRRILHQSPIS
jgi:dCMP deaminase